MSVTLATWNVNSIRQRITHLLAYLDAHKPDILLLQETKIVDEQFPAMEIEERGYNLALCGQKSYNGVAILSKGPLEDVRKALPGDASDGQARYIEAVTTLDGQVMRVASVYVPNGGEVGSEKFAYKLAFFERLRVHWQEWLVLEEVAVMGGDYNVAPEALDVYDPESLDGTVCYHPDERARFRAILHLGVTDAYRALHPEKHEFSWWDYRGGGWEQHKGMRLDHLLLSPHAADRLEACVIRCAMRGEPKASDHVVVEAALGNGPVDGI